MQNSGIFIMTGKLKYYYQIFPLEMFIWITAFLILLFIPLGTDHFSLCPLKNMGLSYCPGCGLGLAVHHLFYMNITDSLSANPLGIPALLIIGFRIYKLYRFSLLQYSFNKRNNHG
jgi:hypothetical protein